MQLVYWKERKQEERKNLFRRETISLREKRLSNEEKITYPFGRLLLPLFYLKKYFNRTTIQGFFKEN